MIDLPETLRLLLFTGQVIMFMLQVSGSVVKTQWRRGITF